MPRKYRKMEQCAQCGIETLGKLRSQRVVLCASCALERVISAAEQMRAKSGPAWDKWLASNGPAGGPRKGTDRKE